MADKSNNQEQDKKTTSSSPKSAGAADAISAKFSGPLAPLEKWLDSLLGKDAPVQIPASGRESLVKLSPWISLVAGILGLVAAIGLWQFAHRIDRLVDFANQLSSRYGGTTSAHLGLAFWLAIVALAVSALLDLLAFPGLKARKKTGWNLLFYGVLFNLVYGVVDLGYNGGISTLIGSLIGTVIGLYLLFQIRSYYK